MGVVPLYPCASDLVTLIRAKYFFFICWQQTLLHKCFSLVLLKHLCCKIRDQCMKEKCFFPDEPH